MSGHWYFYLTSRAIRTRPGSRSRIRNTRHDARTHAQTDGCAFSSSEPWFIDDFTPNDEKAAFEQARISWNPLARGARLRQWEDRYVSFALLAAASRCIYTARKRQAAAFPQYSWTIARFGSSRKAPLTQQPRRRRRELSTGNARVNVILLYGKL